MISMVTVQMKKISTSSMGNIFLHCPLKPAAHYLIFLYCIANEILTESLNIMYL